MGGIMTPTTLELRDLRETGRSRRARHDRAIDGPLLVVGADDGAADGALRIAELLARRDGLNAHVLALVPPLPFTASLLAGVDADSLEEGRRQEALARMRLRVHRTVGLSAYFSTSADVVGPDCAIGRAVRRRNSALVVAPLVKRGTPHRAEMEDLVMQVARAGPAPVLAVSPDADRLPTRSLVAMDFGPASVRAAHAAIRVMSAGGTLTLAHVAPELGAGAPEGSAYDDIYAEGLSGLFARLVLELRIPREIEVETVRLRGEPARALDTLVAQRNFDLVAAGTRSAPWTGTPLTGSVSTALVRGSAHSVLLASPLEAHR
jgi:nucleotide-binding universal stress UspA family protein